MTDAPRLVDTHCHLNLPEFDDDRADVLRRARSAGVERLVVPGIDVLTSRVAVEMAAAHPGVFAAVGIHPHHAADADLDSLAEIRRLAESPGVVAIGEIGLDYFRNLAPAEVQRKAFRNQLELAGSLGLPVIVHSRESSDDILACLAPWVSSVDRSRSSRPGVLHAFSGEERTAEFASSTGFYLGIAGPITYRRSDVFRQLLADLPEEQLLIETDSPYLTPEPLRGRRNEPTNVQLVSEAMAGARGESMSQVAAMTTANAERLFGWKHGTDNSHLL